ETRGQLEQGPSASGSPRGRGFPAELPPRGAEGGAGNRLGLVEGLLPRHLRRAEGAAGGVGEGALGLGVARPAASPIELLGRRMGAGRPPRNGLGHGTPSLSKLRSRLRAFQICTFTVGTASDNRRPMSR